MSLVVEHVRPDGRIVKLGRRARSPHIGGPKRLAARRLLDSLPPAAPSRDWIKAAMAQATNGSLGEMLNDQLGCCTIAAKGHATQIWTANRGTMVTPEDSAILAAYETIDGYKPADPSTDQGGIMVETETAWQAGIDGISKIDDFIPVNPDNLDHVFKAIERFCGIDIGLSLPKTIQGQAVWKMALGAGADAEAGSLGGHDVFVGAYDQARQILTCVTWGEPQDMTVPFFLAYCDEAFAALCELWCAGGASPLGDTVSGLRADLTAVG